METPPAREQHIVGLDLLRFAAALLVVFFHLGYWYWAGGTPGPDTPEPMPALAPWVRSGWIGVQIFFVISGFVIASSAERSTAWSFFVSRVTRLAPAMWICATFSLLLAFTAHDVSRRWELVAWLHSVTFWPFLPYVDPSHWTLPIEISFYAMVLALIATGRTADLRRAALVVGAISSVRCVFALLREHLGQAAVEHAAWLFESRVSSLLLLHHGCEFALGVLAWRAYAGRGTRADGRWAAAFAVGAFAQIVGAAQDFTVATQQFHPPVVPLAIFVAAMGAFALSLRFQHALAARAGTWLGTVRTAGLVTYPLYLLHQTAGLRLMKATTALGLGAPGSLALATAAAVFAGWVVATRLEPPVRRWTRAMLERVRELRVAAAERRAA